MKMLGRHGLANIAMLFVSKAGGVLVVLFFMPLYYRLLGVEQFGIVAVILSLQALLVMLDLGMSTMVGRDVAVLGGSSSQSATTWRNAEVVLTAFYSGLFMLAVAWGVISSPGGLSVLLMASIAILFWIMVLQNLGLTVLLGTKSFKSASSIQLFGALLRASVTVLALQHISATLRVFIVAQLITSMLQLLATRWACINVLTAHLANPFQIKYEISGCKELLKRGKPLLILGIAGAAVMQLDKPIIAAFNSAQDVSTYFLAVTFCMSPIAVLATPVAQYFQPNLIRLVSQKNPKDLQQLLSNFVFVLLLITTLPSTVLWYYREMWIGLWLGHSTTINQTISYVAILLPGVVIGALGYIPFTMLTAQQDYHFQARLSVTMTVITLAIVGYFAYQGNTYAICYAYAAYHFTSTTSSWVRAMYLQKTSLYAKDALIFAIKLLVLIIAISSALKFMLLGHYPIQYQSIIFMFALTVVGIVSALIYFKAQGRALLE